MAEYISREALEKWLLTEMASLDSDADRQCVVERLRKEITAADVRPVVTCADCKHNNACLTQAFVKEESRAPFDRNTFFCADGKKREES